jgi:hypothetical protein
MNSLLDFNLFLSLFNSAFSRCGRNWLWATLRYCVLSQHLLREIEETTDSQPPGQEFNLGISEYEAEVLITQWKCLVACLMMKRKP